jgi:hypothetical protein
MNRSLEGRGQAPSLDNPPRGATIAVVAAALALAGCKMDGDEFVGDYTNAYCTYALACFEPAVLEFEGWQSEGECVESFGPDYAGQYEGCEVDSKTAKQCVKQMDALGCPAEGDDPGESLPEICATVWNCPA